MKTICLMFFVVTFSFAQNISDSRLDKIIRLLTTNSSEISNYVYPEELQASNRFRIEYEGVENKFFIANEIPEELKNDLAGGKIKFNYKLKNLDTNYSLLSINFPSANITKEYYLKDSFIVSLPFYHSRNWEVINSNYFKFFVSDENLFNEYSINLLDEFVNKMSKVLSFSDEENELLQKSKIQYFLCKDENEVKKVTGFTTRGIFILAQDYVVTTYNTHYHELLHFLINFKLKRLPLYTHPFLQEGFAVAFGGRGGLDEHTISELGVFLVKSGFANYKELLSKLDFQSTDASISYSVSGLYTNFLIKQIGVEKYLSLYKKYSGDSRKVFSDKISETDLPIEQRWNLFLDSLSDQNPVKIKYNLDLADFKCLTKQKDFEVYQNKVEYVFMIKDTLLIDSNEIIANYQSKIFNEHFGNRNYKSEKYLIIVSQNEVSVYNLFSNNLIGKYVSSFSFPAKTVLMKNGFYEFVVNKNLFDQELKEINFKN